MVEQRTLANPLTDNDRKTLKGVRTRLNKVLDFVGKLEAAGINCEERRDLCVQLNEMVDGLERVFPPQPSSIDSE